LFLFFFTTSFPTSLLRQYPDLQSFPVQKIVNQIKHSGYQSVASEKSTCKDEECVLLQMSELCDVPQRHDVLRSCGNDATKGTKTTRFASLTCIAVFFFLFFGAILCRSQSGDDLQKHLTKFGYKLNMRVIFKEIPSIFLASY
jgi:hypothetical protein